MSIYKAVTSSVWTDDRRGAFVYLDPATHQSTPTDASAYRPDPRTILKTEKKYTAQLIFETSLVGGQLLNLIRVIVVGKNVFTKIR